MRRHPSPVLLTVLVVRARFGEARCPGGSGLERALDLLGDLLRPLVDDPVRRARHAFEATGVKILTRARHSLVSLTGEGGRHGQGGIIPFRRYGISH